MEDDLKKNLFLIPLKVRGKPFLGLAQLSKVLLPKCNKLQYGILGRHGANFVCTEMCVIITDKSIIIDGIKGKYGAKHR